MITVAAGKIAAGTIICTTDGYHVVKCVIAEGRYVTLTWRDADGGTDGDTYGVSASVTVLA